MLSRGIKNCLERTRGRRLHEKHSEDKGEECLAFSPRNITLSRLVYLYVSRYYVDTYMITHRPILLDVLLNLLDIPWNVFRKHFFAIGYIAYLDSYLK